MIKRLFDFIISLLGLILLSPLYLIISLLIMIKLGRPVFFTQERPGFQCKVFKMIKFRSMTNEKDHLGNLLPNEERITSFGTFLRSTSLDELPGLINVLKGDMSLVSPRPLLIDYLPFYSDLQNKRHNVKPGITGWSQVNGRNAISWDKKLELDVWYVDNQNFWLDLKILFMTLVKVFRREDISHDGYFSMPRFDEYVKQKLKKNE